MKSAKPKKNMKAAKTKKAAKARPVRAAKRRSRAAERAEKIKFLSFDDLRRRGRSIGRKRDKVLFLIAYRHGLRASEVGKLWRDDLDLKRMMKQYGDSPKSRKRNVTSRRNGETDSFANSCHPNSGPPPLLKPTYRVASQTARSWTSPH